MVGVRTAHLAGSTKVEARAVRGRVPVAQLAAVGVRVHLRDREPESGAAAALAVAARAAREALEQARGELARDTVAAILDDDGQPFVARARRDRDGRPPVQQAR